MAKDKLTYSKSGVNYTSLDFFKRLSQSKAKSTSNNLTKLDFSEIEESRGESAYVWEEENCYRAFVLEALGTKNLIADEMRKITGKTYYDFIGQDIVACIINDLVVVGARPLVLNMFAGVGTSEWFDDEVRSKDLTEGFAKACNLANVTWGGGETPGLKNVIEENKIVLAGAATGIVKPKKNLILGDKLSDGDVIVLIESSGIHTNGLSLARALAKNLPEGYATKMLNGEMFGEALLVPSFIYAKLVQDLLKKNIDISYMVHLTGHGFRKLMRANKDFTYEIDNFPPVSELFKFIQEKSGFSNEEMYGTFNMGAGFAIFVPKEFAEKIIAIAKENGFKAWKSGEVKRGEKQVIIKPLGITYPGKSLEVR